MTAPWIIRPIRQEDDHAIEAIIHEVMREHGCAGEGFAIHDAEVAAMSRGYQTDEARYYVVENANTVLGGAGFGECGLAALLRGAGLRERGLRGRSTLRGATERVIPPLLYLHFRL